LYHSPSRYEKPAKPNVYQNPIAEEAFAGLMIAVFAALAAA
jgi:hypothetical protein